MKGRGWECRMFCGPQLDYEEPRAISALLKYVNLPYEERPGNAHGLDFVLYNTIKDVVDMIIRLWDDESFYVQACVRARAEAEKWQPACLADQYEAYFRKILDAK